MNLITFPPELTALGAGLVATIIIGGFALWIYGRFSKERFK